MTVGELAERMDASELIEWIEFDDIYTQPARVDAALICLNMVRLVGNKGLKLEDFLPHRKRVDPPAPSADGLGERIKAWASARIAAEQGRPISP